MPFSGADLATAVAIALAESNPPGNPNSYNPETQAGAPLGKGSYGLWQIYLNKHPEYAGVNLYDPQTNANAAFALYSASGSKPWSTYNSGKYQRYLSWAVDVRRRPRFQIKHRSRSTRPPDCPCRMPRINYLQSARHHRAESRLAGCGALWRCGSAGIAGCGHDARMKGAR
jgi:hypothetical protein